MRPPKDDPGRISVNKDVKGDVHPSQLSAFAVYNNLVPGVKVFQDTAASTPSSTRKKNRKKNRKKLLKGEDSSETTGAASKEAKGDDGKPNPALSMSKQVKGIQKSSKELELPSSKNNKKATSKLNDNNNSQVEAISSKNKKKKRKSEDALARAEAETERISTAKVRKLNIQKQDAKYLPNPFANGVQKKKKNLSEHPSSASNGSKGVDVGSSSKIKPQNGSSKLEKAKPSTKQTAKNVSLVPSASGKSQAKSHAFVTKVKSVEEPPHSEENKKSKKTMFETYATEDPVSTDAPDVTALLNARVVDNSVELGKSLFEWLIHPQPISNFVSNHWEKSHFLVKRNMVTPEYYNWILTSSGVDDILRKNVLKYSENLDVTIYADGVRETVSKDLQGRARPAAVWDYYATGHSVRLLNPQTYCKPLWKLNAALQEYFGCFVGANMYLTPPDSQGFAPHYDDIEAFILQVEGKKRWKLYKSRNPEEELPRFSSRDFTEADNLGKPILDVILEEGDLLYFPRGMIHEAKTVEGYHSMHLTLSCYQQNNWGDLLKHHLMKSVDKLISTNLDFRKGLPMDYLSFMGMAHSNSKNKYKTSKRKTFQKKIHSLMEKVMSVEADDAADEMGKKFIWDSLPPCFTKREKDHTVEEDGDFMNDGKVKNRVEFDPDVEVKLVRKNSIRLIREENSVRLYFSVDNSMIYHEEEPKFLEVPTEFINAVEYLIQQYPEFTRTEDLPMHDGDLVKKIQIVSDLWEKGILMTKKPLEAGEIDDEEFEFDDEEYEFEDEDELEDADLDDIALDSDQEYDEDEETDESEESGSSIDEEYETHMYEDVEGDEDISTAESDEPASYAVEADSDD